MRRSSNAWPRTGRWDWRRATSSSGSPPKASSPATSAVRLLTADNTVVRRLHVLLSGRVAIHVNRGGPRRVMEWRGGDVTGALPYSRLVSAPGDAMVEETADVCVLDRSSISRV